MYTQHFHDKARERFVSEVRIGGLIPASHRISEDSDATKASIAGGVETLMIPLKIITHNERNGNHSQVLTNTSLTHFEPVFSKSSQNGSPVSSSQYGTLEV